MTKVSPRSWQIAIVLCVGIVAASSSAIFIRLALGFVAISDRVTLGIFLAASRLFLATIVLIPSWQGFRQSGYSTASLRYGLIAGVCLALHFATWIPSLAFTSIAASTALVTTNPIWVVLITWIWKGDRPQGAQWLGILLALVGAIVVGFGDLRTLGTVFSGSNPLLGNSLALCGSWAVSFYLVCGQQAQQEGLSLKHYIGLAYTVAALTLLPFPQLFGQGYFQYGGSVYFYTLLLAIFPQLIGHTSFNWSLRWLSTTLVTLVILAEPIGSSLFGWWIFAEIPSPTVLWGALVLLSGVVVTAIAHPAEAPTPHES
ncbi:MAG: DMT family transporter [Prochlorotrichaceae cyanobacterium]|jgi:drug/metabolite transporter (DMT)-like permease